MSRTNVPASQAGLVNATGLPLSQALTPLQELQRAALTSLLWEDNYYEKGNAQAQRIADLVAKCRFEDVAALALQSRTDYHLRHLPLFLVRELLRKPQGAKGGKLLTDVIQRADEIAEFLALYWKDGKTPISKQVRLGLAAAFRKFDAYQLAKWDHNKSPIRLRDVLFLVHAKPVDGQGRSKANRKAAYEFQRDTGNVVRHVPALTEAEALYAQLASDTLPVPGTWETELSAGKDKKETFERLIRERKLGTMAFLRNLRGMVQAGVSHDVIRDGLTSANWRKVLPFRFIAAKQALQAAGHLTSDLLQALEGAMLGSMGGLDRLPGRTLLLVDVSGSMDAKLSQKSDLTRLAAAQALAILIMGVGERCAVATFSNNTVVVPPYKGFALADAIEDAQPHAGTYLGKAVQWANNAGYDRLIVITDEQSHDKVPAPLEGSEAYLINVAGYKNGVDLTDGWLRIHGFSEQVVTYIQAVENLEVAV